MLPLGIPSQGEFVSCRAKVCYRTKKSARSKINSLLRGHRTHGRAADLRTYCCPVCHGWHLTKDVVSKSGNLRAVTFRLLMHRFEVRRRRELFAARHPLDDLSPYLVDLG